MRLRGKGDQRHTLRLWSFRLLAAAIPLVALGGLEVGLRLADAFPPDPWANRTVEFEPGTVPFPSWDATVRMPKPEGLVRVLALGGSTTLGFGVEEPFAALLEAQLERLRPAREWEVLNGGRIAIGSHRIYEVLRRGAEFDPDLAIVYLGHNEFLEDVFFDPEGLVARASRIGELARRLRVVALARSVLPQALRPEGRRPRLQRHFLGNNAFPLIRSREQYESRLAFLRANLAQMADFAEAHGFPLVLAPAVPNLLEEPGDSVHATQGEARRRWRAAWREGRAALAARDFERAAAALGRAAAIDPRHAATRHQLGIALFAAGREEEGLAALEAANLLDRRGDRSNLDVRNAILAFCAERDVVCVDPWPEFRRALAAELRRTLAGAPPELFLDHCHPGASGHRLLARILRDAVLRRSDASRVSAKVDDASR